MAAMTGRAGWMPWWAWAWPALAWILLIVALADGVGGAFAAVMAVVLIGTVFAAVHHAEVSAHRIGEPFGTLVLAVAVTVIEVGLIVSIMLAPGPGRAELARDTVFAAVVLLAKALSPTLEAGIARVGAPKTLVGVVIAAIVLLPEAVAALRAAWADLLQTSLNLALGSAPASIGLTIPAVAVVSIVLGQPISLGLDAKEEVLLGLTFLVGVLTLGTGRTTVLQGVVHLVILAAFLFLAVVP